MTDNFPNWFDRNKFEKILAIIDSNKFNYKNKIGEFKYIDIKDLVNNIKNNTISEIDAKKDLNKLNEIKNVETMKYKKRTPGHKELLNLFNDLFDIILTDKTLESESQEDENEKVESRKEDNEDEDYEHKFENEDEGDYYENNYENKNEHDDDETRNQNEIIKGKNDLLDKIIDKSMSFEDQIKSFKIVKNQEEYYFINDFGEKELKFKIFKPRLAHLSNKIDEDLFEQIFGHTLINLADKLINTTNKVGNQIIVKNINKNDNNKLSGMDDFNDWVIQPSDQRIDLIDAIDLILDFNKSKNENDKALMPSDKDDDKMMSQNEIKNLMII